MQCRDLKTEDGVISALDNIALKSNIFDIVVIIRGGGSQSDLSWFDNYNIAYHITQFPLPVITGIGHDKDMSVTDMVANRALKTPTAAAGFLIDSVAGDENQLNEIYLEIKEFSQIIIEKNKNRIESCKTKLIPLARIIISGVSDTLSEKKLEFINVGKECTFRAGLTPANQESRLVSALKSFSSEKKTALERMRSGLISETNKSLNIKNSFLDGIKNTLNILDPENVLQRGYTITSLNGRILKKSSLIVPDDLIDTQFSDGTVRSRVEGKKG